MSHPKISHWTARHWRGIARLLAGSCIGLASAAAMAACLFSVPGWKVTNEGVLLARYAADASGPGLTGSTTYATADPAQVRAAFDSTRLTFDITGDNAVTGVDALLALRYVLGLRGAALTHGLQLAGGTRATLAAVTTFMDEGCVAPIVRRGPIYEALPATATRTDLLAQANAQGARGYQYVGPLIQGAESFNLYALDTPGTQVGFSYRSLDTPTSSAEFIAQLNSQGAERYRFVSVFDTGSLFVRDAGSTRTFQYQALSQPATASAFVTQANAQGALGYAWVGPYAFGLSSIVMIYEKDSGTATYAYALEASTNSNATADDFVSQANTRGATGWKYRTGYAFGDGSRNIYFKDLSQAATFIWKHDPDATSAATLVAQANAEGALGYAYSGAMVFFPGGIGNPLQTRTLYVQPTNCAGTLMCTPHGLF